VDVETCRKVERRTGRPVCARARPRGVGSVGAPRPHDTPTAPPHTPGAAGYTNGGLCTARRAVTAPPRVVPPQSSRDSPALKTLLETSLD
jgi:hypothetical protein